MKAAHYCLLFMSEENRTNRTDYRVSVEAGLRRLESEKLSFLGSSRVISKFNPENIEEFSQIDSDDDDDDATIHERIDTQSILSATGTTLQEIQHLPQDDDDEDNSHVIDPTFSMLKTLDSSSSVMTASNAVLSHSSDTDAADEDKTSAVTLNFASAKNYDSFASLPQMPPSKSEDLSDLDSCETKDVSDIASQIRSNTLTNSDDFDLESSETKDVSSIAAEIRKKKSLELDDYQMEVSETNDVSNIAKELRFENARTVDVGHQADLVREALAAKECVPTAQVMKLGIRPPNRDQRPAKAMDRLKEQGIFAPVPVIHHEVNRNIENIQAMDQILPRSDVQTWKGDFTQNNEEHENEGGDQTIPQDPEAIDELKHVAQLVKAAREAEEHEPKVVPIPGTEELDIESRQTIPIEVSSVLPEILKTSPSARRHSAEIPTSAFNPLPQENEESTHLIIWLVIIIILTCGILFMLYLMGAFAKISPWLDPNHSEQAQIAEIESVTFDTPEEMAASIHEASLKVASAIDYNTWMASWLEKKLNQQSTDEAKLIYLETGAEFFPDNQNWLEQLIELSISTKQIDKARELLKQANASGNHEFAQKMKIKLLLNDPKFLPDVMTLTENECDTIDPLGGGSTLTFKMKLNGQNIGAFKPLQTRRQSNYRSEIAAWRLCELLECDFSVPWNRPIRIEHALFNKLFSRSNSKKASTYRKELVDLIWTKEDGKTYVYGTLKDWVPDFTRFPIELTSFWKPWLAQDDYIADLGTLEKVLLPLKRNKNTQNLHTEILEQSSNLTAAQLAAQVSEVLVFDYLIGNWDRFSGVPDWWGVNCQYKDGRIVSIDNGASFPSYSNDKVKERFLMTERYSAHFIESLRNLDKEQTLNMLFPNPSKHETESFEQFWKQRASVLTRVENLSERYGTEKVLSL